MYVEMSQNLPEHQFQVLCCVKGPYGKALDLLRVHFSVHSRQQPWDRTLLLHWLPNFGLRLLHTEEAGWWLVGGWLVAGWLLVEHVSQECLA